MTENPDSIELREHFAGLMDRQDAQRLDEAEMRAWRHELDRLYDEREGEMLAKLADGVEQGLHHIALMHRMAGLRLPLIENISRDNETSVTFICTGHQYRLSAQPSFHSVPAQFKYEMRTPLTKDLSGEWGWRTFHSVDLGHNGSAGLAMQATDYFFEKSIENFTPSARERLHSGLYRLPSPVLAAQP
jgi:hypothetical protein